MKAIIHGIIGAILYLFDPAFRKVVDAKVGDGIEESVNKSEEVIVVLKRGRV